MSSLQCDFDVDVTRRIIDYDSLRKSEWSQPSYTCVITAPPRRHTRVKFSIFRLPHFYTLQTDWLYVYDGNTKDNTLLGKFTGTKRPFTVQSSGCSIMIQLKKYSRLLRSTFRASYRYPKKKGKLIFILFYRWGIHHIGGEERTNRHSPIPLFNLFNQPST